MKQFKIFDEFDKEEAYLNSMAKKGYIFKKCSNLGFYHFLEGEKQNLNIRIDYRVFNNKRDFEEYKIMFNDFGWEHISGTAYSGNQYFLCKDNGANNDIFSSKESSTSRYKRLLKIFFINIILLISYCFTILECYWYNGSNFSISSIELWSWIPLIIFITMILFYGIRIILVYKKYKNKLKY